MSKIKPEASRRKKIIKSRNNEIGNIKSRENEQNKGWFFKKINKIDKPLTRPKKKNKKRRHNSKNEIGDITTDPADVKSSKEIIQAALRI